MCTTCYDAPEMTTAEVMDLIDQAASWGVRVFNPLGGEAFVRHDLEDILAYAARKDFHVTLTTNGTLVSPGRAARIAQIPTEKLHINLSLDGPEAIHDVIRGQGSFKRAIAGYRHIREADAAAGNPKRKICCNAILHRKNVDVFVSFVRWLVAEGFDGVQVLNLFRNDADDSVSGMWFAAESLPALQAVCSALADEPGVLNHREDLQLVPRYYREGLKPLDAPCWAGWKELYINADGSAIMCDGKLDFLAGKFGSTKDATLRELWGSAALRERRKVVKACSTPCIQNCYLRRESDSIAAVMAEAIEQVRRPEWLPKRALRTLPQTLTLELCDIPDTPDDPRLVAFFGESPVAVSELYHSPDRLIELRDRRYLDFGRGFLGFDVARRILEAIDGAGVRYARVALRWRGEPLLHPEFFRILSWISARSEVVVHTSGLLAAGAVVAGLRNPQVAIFVDPSLAGRFASLSVQRAQALGAQLGPPPSAAGPAISWEGRVTASAADVTLASKVGDALKEPFADILRRL